jgi:hypothetical protein
VRKVSPEGVVTLAAGADAGLLLPFGVVATTDGGFLIADTGNHVVRKVSPDGVTITIAGTGSTGNGGDDGPAIHAQLNLPEGAAASSDGGFLIADTGNHVVRKVSPEGVITRVAGTGAVGNSGDDGPATAAEFNLPQAVAFTADGGFLIADLGNHVVRKVASGI